MTQARAFSGRLQRASIFEKRLFDQIEAMGFQVAINGTEHTHPNFVNLLRQSQDQTSLAIRFQPDAVACIGPMPHSFFVEAKAAKTIEKTAYEQYIKLQNNGNILIVVFEKLNWRWAFIDELRLIDGSKTVGRYPPDTRFPVVDGWIYPRQSRRWLEIRERNAQASGTPWREIDQSSLSEWQLFYLLVTSRLT